MHILVTNDDGPPSTAASPFILPFVRALERVGHTVSVIIPDAQRSWIGKAHLVGQDVVATPYWAPATNPDVHSPSNQTSDGGDGSGGTVESGGEGKGKPWILVNSTPASCAQLGLSTYFFQSPSTPPIGLVISGPNYGRNTTAVFALSSGTLGAALEAAVCGAKAIALSFAFFDRVTGGEIVEEACEHSVRVCEGLANVEGKGGDGKVEWGDGRLYSVNVPLQRGVSGRAVRWTRMLQNRWEQGACFQEVEGEAGSKVEGPEAEEVRLRRGEELGEGEAGSKEDAGSASAQQQRWKARHFKWASVYGCL
ncbi:hypothetical protein LTR82_014875 [Friedmanniomyces endolithicus]|uniref:Survival protein SurE-like phosphatase/nucleotidase domain-containing protein n=1 Tax=Friedmanniomyces endolithicus TaxID=329885 RepID=A0AAN6J2J9_9PEZI|nr:hypothetical protein LTR82_014875 [Friedmanniomyces endolithicus]